jgi:hypothetical protein
LQPSPLITCKGRTAVEYHPTWKYEAHLWLDSCAMHTLTAYYGSCSFTVGAIAGLAASTGVGLPAGAALSIVAFGCAINAGMIGYINSISDGNGFYIKVNTLNRGDFGAWIQPLVITEQ